MASVSEISSRVRISGISKVDLLVRLSFSSLRPS
jgi:hypothetical protein